MPVIGNMWNNSRDKIKGLINAQNNTSAKQMTDSNQLQLLKNRIFAWNRNKYNVVW